MSIAKEEIESKVSHKDILYHFLKSYYHGKPFKEGEFVHVPEISGEQKTPSFNIYYSSDSQTFRWKDWTGNDGSAFDLVMRLYNVDFPESLKIIDKEMFLNIEEDKSNLVYTKKPTPIRDVPEVEERNYNYDVEEIDWNDELLSYWNQYGIKLSTLNIFDTIPARSVFGYNKLNKPLLIKATKNNPIYVYNHEGWIKVYMPLSEFNRFLFFGKKPSDYIFGFDKLPPKMDKFNLVGGEKDVMSLFSHQKWAACLDSEVSNPIKYPELLKFFKEKRAKHNYIMYDNDPTGLRRMDEIAEEFPILQKRIIPAMEFGNDISDWYKNKYNGKIR